MTLRTLAVLVALLVSPTSAFTQGTDLDALVAEEAITAAERPVEELWTRAIELREADRFGDEGELDREIDGRLGDTTRLTPAGTLLLSASRLLGPDPDPILLMNSLLPLIESEDDELGQGVATLLGNRVFRGLTRGRKGDLVESMLAAANDGSRPPAYRLEFAKSASRIGNGSERREANDIMQSFLDSEDPELRAQGALAIAAATAREIDGRLREVLEQIAQVPDERGALARAYLDREDERRLGDRKLRDLRRNYEESATKRQTVPPSLREFLSVLNMIERSHLEGDKVTHEDLINSAVTGMLQWMDPHSSFLPSNVYAKFFQDLEAEYGGIGAYVNEDPDSGLFTIVRPIYSGPAYEAGLTTDDKIVRIGDWPTLRHTEEEIIKRLKGKPGTPVELYIWKRGMDSELIDRPTDDMKVTVVREKIEIPAGTYQLLPGGIGLVELTTFSGRSMEQLRRWITEMKRDGMRALVLDMRRNNGGLLTEAREVADLFLPRGKVVVSTEGRNQRGDSLRTLEEALIEEDVPLAILTSRMTASAAEIVSGALQDHGRATLIGKTTFGKGSVQQLLRLTDAPQDEWDDENGNQIWDPGERITKDYDGDGEFDYAPRVKLTIARYLLPSGRSIHRELDREGNLVTEGGVSPDHEVEMPLLERARFEEWRKVRQDDALRDYVEEYYDEHRELFGRLAVNDLKDPSQYPDFDRLHTALNTPLSRDDVRHILRQAIRRRVQDDLGREFPYGDYVEDPQLQKAIEVVLTELGESVDDVTEYGLVFDLAPFQEGSPTLATLRPSDVQNLRRARALLEEVKSGQSTLTAESVEELLTLIQELEAEEN